MKTCPECGTNDVKILVPMTENAPAYLCKNGHFFLVPVPTALLLPSKMLVSRG